MRRIITLVTITALCPLFTASCSDDVHAPVAGGTAVVSNVLSNPNVTSVVEDSEGCMWIGTVNGLNRFDGSSYVQFHHTDSVGLTDNNIQGLFRDSGDRLWVCTIRGVSLFDPAAVGFRRVPNSVLSNNFIEAAETTGGRIFFNSVLQIALYDEDAGVIIPVYNITNRVYNTRMFMDRFNNLWFVNGSSLFCMDTGTCEVTAEYDAGGYVNDGELLPNDEIWLGTQRGVRRFDINLRSFVSGFSPSEQGDVVSEAIIDNVIPVGKTGVLISTRRDGDFHYDLSARRLLSRQDPDFPQNIPRAEINTAYTDSRSNIWFGTYDKGVAVDYYYNRKYGNSGILDRQTKGDNVLSMSVSLSGGLWTSTRNGRLNLFENGLPVCSCQVKDIFTGQRGISRVNTLLCDRKGFIWMASSRNLALAKYADGALKVYKVYDFDDDINCVLEDNSGTIWVFGNGRYCYYCFRGENEFRSYDLFEKDTFSSATSAAVLPDGGIAVAAFYNGIILIDPVTMVKRASVYPVFTEDNQFLPYCLALDSEGWLWLGSGKGIFLSRTCDIDSFERVGDPSEIVNNIIEDVQGNIWTGTADELKMYDKTVGRFTMTHAVSASGESAAKFNMKSACVLADHSLAFGTTDGIVSFDPVDIFLDRQVPVKFEYVRFNNERTLFLASSSGIAVPSDVKNFTINYAALDYSDYPRIIYSYRMEGFDTNWIDAGRGRMANYSNLPPGRYCFRVRVESSDASIGISEASIPVAVQAPVMLRWWMMAIYTLLACCVAWIVVRLARNNRAARRETLRALEEKEEEARINDMNMSFFSNISHEFRTPLTMISGPVALLSEDPLIAPEKREMLSIVRNNVDRMLRLVSQVMDFSKLDKDALKLMVSQDDIISTVNRVIDSFSMGMEEKRIVLYAYGLEDSFICYYDSDKLDKILSNLLSNALKFTPPGGRVELRFDVVSRADASEVFPDVLTVDGQYVKIEVKDTGGGLPPDRLEAVFERFYQINADSVEQYNWGTGLGLYYTRSLVTLHHGAIKAGNRERGGSVFTFVIPVSATAFREQEFARAEVPSFSAGETVDDGAENACAVKADDGRQVLLVVDDDADVVHYVKSILSGEYNVITSFDADEAFGLIEEYAPDIVLSDVIMPGKNGYQLCSMIKDNISFCHIPVILITAKTTVDDRVTGFNAGADAYVTKPFEINYLKALIRSQLRNRDLSRRKISEVTGTGEIDEEILSPNDKVFMDSLFELMEKELSNTELNVNMMTDLLHMSRTKLYYKVKGLTGENPNVFFRKYKLNRAAQLVLEGRYNLSEIADLTGFSTLAHFSSCFKKQFGVAPSSYRSTRPVNNDTSTKNIRKQ